MYRTPIKVICKDEEREPRRYRYTSDYEQEEEEEHFQPWTKRNQVPYGCNKPWYKTNNFWRVHYNLGFHCRPEDIKTKLDLQNHMLMVTIYRGPTQPKWRQTVMVPRNVDVKHMTVKLITHPNYMLVIKAPFIGWNWQCRQEQEVNQLPRIYGNKFYAERRPFDMMGVCDYPFQGCFVPCCVKDMKTGLWNLCIDVNTLGFNMDHIKVFYDRNKNRLVVKAKRDMTNIHKEDFKHCPTTSLYKEFCIPTSMLDMTRMCYDVTHLNGILRVMIPCLNNRPIKVACHHMKCLNW